MKTQSGNKKVLEALPKKNSKIKLFLSFFLGIIIGAIGIYLIAPTYKQEQEQTKIKKLLPVKQKTKNLINPFVIDNNVSHYNLNHLKSIDENLSKECSKYYKSKKVSTLAVYIKDLTNDDSFGFNETELFSPASLMKVPVMIAVLKLAQEDPSVLKSKLVFKNRREAEYIPNGDFPFNTQTTLIPARSYTVDRLLDIMITESDNEATILLLDFLDATNPTILENVQLSLGLVIPEGAVNKENFVAVKVYSSFFRTLYNASFLNREMSEKALVLLSRTGYGFGIRQSIPKDIIVSHKFGYKLISDTEVQLHHFGIVFYDRKPFLIGIMTKGFNIEELQRVISEITTSVFKEVSNQCKQDGRTLEMDIN